MGGDAEPGRGPSPRGSPQGMSDIEPSAVNPDSASRVARAGRGTAIEPVAHGLDSTALLAGLSPAALRAVEQTCRWTELKPGDIVFEREDDSRDVFFVVRGSVRAMNFLGSEREVSLADLPVGSHFGELSAVDNRERSARVVANEPAVIAALARDDFLAMLHAHPQVTVKLLGDFASIIRTTNQRVFSLSMLTPRQRVYLEILRMAEPNPKGDGSWLIEIVPNHNEIASWAGTDKLEVANAIGSLVRDGVLERKFKSFIIKDHTRLKSLASM